MKLTAEEIIGIIENEIENNKQLYYEYIDKAVAAGKNENKNEEEAYVDVASKYFHNVHNLHSLKYQIECAEAEKQ